MVTSYSFFRVFPFLQTEPVISIIHSLDLNFTFLSQEYEQVDVLSTECVLETGDRTGNRVIHVSRSLNTPLQERFPVLSE